MSSLLDYSLLIVRNLNIGVGQCVEIVTPLECKELAETLKDVLVRSFVNVSITYNNECDEYYLALGDDYYDKLIESQFARISIISSFTESKSKKYLEAQSMKVRNYLYSSHSQRTVVAYQNEIWAKRLGITYLELKNRIIDMALRGNPLSKYIDDLYNCDIKYARLKSKIGTNLYMEFTDGFVFNDGFIKTEDGIPFKANIPCLEIFTSPIKSSLRGHVEGSKPVYINGRIIRKFSIDFIDGEIVSSTGIDSILNDPSLFYCGELGIAYYSDFLFYNTLLDENLSTHIALGNSYYMGVKKKERNKLNISFHHIDLPIDDGTLEILFYDKEDRLKAKFKNSGLEIYDN